MQAMAQGLQPMIPSHMLPTMVACESGQAGSVGKMATYQPASQHQAVTIAGPQHYPMMAAHPYMTAMQNAATYSPYMHGSIPVHQGQVVSPIEPAISPTVSAASQVSAGIPAAPKVARADRLEQSSSPSACSDSGVTSVSPYGTSYDSLSPLPVAPSQYSHMYFQGMSMPGMMPMMKRPAMTDSKSGIPMYQPTSQSAAAAAYHQQAALAAMQLHQPFAGPVTIAGHPPSVPRF